MIYMAAVSSTAATLLRGPAAVSRVLSVAALNSCFVPPRRSLVVDGAEYWWISNQSSTMPRIGRWGHSTGLP
jgi:K+-sensing histidine kinase KdpD